MVQRTTRRQCSLKDGEDVLVALESAGIDREQVLAINRGKVDEVFDVVSLVESAVYDTDEWSRGGGNEDRVKEISHLKSAR